MVKIRFQIMGERMYNKLFHGASESYYNSKTRTIKLIYYDFNTLINEVDHETTHHILTQLEGNILSKKFDNTTLQLEMAVGFKNFKVFGEFILNNDRITERCKKEFSSILRSIEDHE